MTKQVQRRRGTAAQHTSFTGAEGEISVNTTNKSVHVHDGVTAGGVEAARADLDNVSSASVLSAAGITATATELNYTDGVTSAIQTQLDGKAPINNTTFTGTTVIPTADINGGTIDGVTIGASAAPTVTNIDINGGTIDGTVIGGASAAAISGTTGTFSGNLTVDTDTLFVDAANNRVGVGTTSPAYDLTLSNSANSVSFGMVTPSGRNFVISSESDGVNDDVVQVFNKTSSAGQFAFEINSSEKLRIDSSGNVGIGITAPDGPLTVKLAAFNNTSWSMAVEGTNTAQLSHIISDSTSVRRKLSAIESFVGSSDVSNFQGGLIFKTTPAAGSPTERVRIDASGNVGVGTSSPSSRLHVSASNGDVARIAGTTRSLYFGADSGGMMLGTGASQAGNSIYFNEASNFLYFQTASTERMRIDSSGNVGIGTSSPLTNLHVSVSALSGYTNVANSGLLIERGNGPAALNIASPNTESGFIWFADQDSQSVGNIAYNHPSNFMSFQTNGSERMRITSTGNVGIGTSSPTQKLQISGAGSQYASVISTDSGNTGILLGDAAKVDEGYVLYANSDNSLRFGSAGTERMRIDSSGNVGIGNTSVTSGIKLDVNGVIRAGTGANQAFEGGWSVANSFVFVQGYDRTAATFQPVALTGSDLRFLTGSSPSERMRIDASGNLLVGTTSWAAGQNSVRVNNFGRIDISRNITTNADQIYFANPNGVVGAIVTSGSSTAYNTSSDYRLKENVVPLSGAAARLAQIPVHRFNFIADPDTTVDGFLAHEVQAFVPEAVTGLKDEVDAEGNPVYQGIDQSKLVPLLTAALQEALTKIEALEARITALEA